MYGYGRDGSVVTNRFSNDVFDYDLYIWAKPLTQSGNYSLVCYSHTSVASSSYTVVFAKVVGDNPMDEDAATLVAGETHRANFTSGDIDVFRFAGATGEVVSLDRKSVV